MFCLLSTAYLGQREYKHAHKGEEFDILVMIFLQAIYIGLAEHRSKSSGKALSQNLDLASKLE